MLKRLLVVIGLAGVVAAVIGMKLWYQPLNNNETVRIEVKAGQTLGQVSKQWEQEGWLPSSLLLRVQARVYGSHLKAGEYEIPPAMNSAELLPYLSVASPVAHRLTFIEGQKLRDVLNQLSKNPNIELDIQPFNLAEVGRQLKIDGSPEGWIYPDTYVYHKGDKVSAILRQGYERMQKHLEEAWQNRAANLPYETPYDALIMASIIEKETGVASERTRIAGVFVRRLQKGMRLETDPTIIYGLGSEFNGNLTRKHLLDKDNIWNTYRHHGLPPTPIALPGRASIEAALHPAAGNEVFFVARGDGSHVFSATLEEHNKAVRHYQVKNRASNYRSAPKTTMLNVQDNSADADADIESAEVSDAE